MKDSLKILGRGSYGFVVLLKGHPRIAAKYSLKTKNSSFEIEWQALQMIRHPNIVYFYGFGEDGLFDVIKMEYCERNSLFEVLTDTTIVFSMKTVFCWAEHLFSALCHLSELGIVHRDIKPKNVLVKQDFVLKLGDFGCVRELDAAKTASMAGTYRYMSPEVYGLDEKSQVNSKTDLYSIGLVLWEIAERRTVYDQYGVSCFSYHLLFADLKSGKFKLEEAHLSHSDLQKIIENSTSLNSNDRPDVSQTYEMIRSWNEEMSGEMLPDIYPTHSRLIRPFEFEDFDPGCEKSLSVLVPDASLFSIKESCSISSPTNIDQYRSQAKSVPNETQSANDSTILSNTQPKMDIDIKKLLNDLKIALSAQGLKVKRAEKGKELEKYARIPEDYRLMIGDLPNQYHKCFLTKEDLKSGSFFTRKVSLNREVRFLLSECDIYFHTALKSLHSGYNQLVLKMSELVTVLTSEFVENHQIELFESLNELSQLKVKLEQNYFYKNLLRAVSVREKGHRYFVFSKRNEVLLLRTDFEFLRETVDTARERFPDLYLESKNDSNTVMDVEGFHIDFLFTLLKNKLLELEQNVERQFRPPDLFMSMLEDSGTYPFVQWRFLLNEDLKTNPFFENSSVDKDILRAYQQQYEAFSWYFEWLKAFWKSGYCGDMTEYLKKSLQETDGQCPNFFLFAKISEDRLLLELPSDENGQQALTIDRHLSMQRVQVEWWDLRKFALITVNDLVETINVVVSLGKADEYVSIKVTSIIEAPYRHLSPEEKVKYKKFLQNGFF